MFIHHSLVDLLSANSRPTAHLPLGQPEQTRPWLLPDLVPAPTETRHLSSFARYGTISLENHHTAAAHHLGPVERWRPPL